jgi:hypothetical protein
MFEVEARVLEGAWSFGDRLSDIMNSLLRGDLEVSKRRRVFGDGAYHDLDFLWFVREVNGQLENSFLLVLASISKTIACMQCFINRAVLLSMPWSPPSSPSWLVPLVVVCSTSVAFSELAAELSEPSERTKC